MSCSILTSKVWSLRGSQADSLSRGEWFEYDWIRWWGDGDDHRLQFGRRDQRPGEVRVLTGHIQDVQGDWSSENSVTEADMSGTAHVVLCGPANHAPDRVVGPFETAEAAEAWAAAHQREGRYAVAQELTRPVDAA
jgi:hypothetical protein